MKYLREHKEGTLLNVHAQPRASRNSLVGIHGDAVKIAVSSPPVDSAANEAIRELISETLGVPKARVELRSGTTSRKKVFLLRGFSKSEVAKLLEGKIS